MGRTINQNLKNMYINNGLLSYCWKHKLYGEGLKTTDGKSVDVADAGLFDRNHGPRFFNAKLKIDGTLYVGNVLVLNESNDFYGSFPDYRKDSQSIILVVCNRMNGNCIDSNGNYVPILELEIPEQVRRNANALMANGGDILCHSYIMQYNSRLLRHAWFAAMQTEFIEEESSYLKSFYDECGNDLEETFFCAILRAYGFNVNKVTMDLLARNTPLKVLEHHRDDLFQIEAILMGQAGLLTLEPTVQCGVPEKYLEAAMKEGYLPKLRNEWIYLKNKYSMVHEISKLCWYPYGNGGWNYPHVFISTFANWYYSRKMTALSALQIETVDEAMNLFNSHCTPYWENHFMFGADSKKSEKHLSNDRKAWIVVAALVPFLFFWGRQTHDDELCDRAFDFMEWLKTFQTAETKHFKKYGLVPEDAGQALALTHMKNAYCCHQIKADADDRECLRCRFGFQFIKNH